MQQVNNVLPVVAAIRRLNRPCTAAQVALESDMDVTVVEPIMRQVLVDANGQYNIKEESVVFSFPSDFEQKLRMRRVSLRIAHFADKMKGILFYMVRMFFGLFLILSVALVLIAIIVVLVAVATKSQGGGGGGGSHRGGGGRTGDVIGHAGITLVRVLRLLVPPHYQPYGMYYYDPTGQLCMSLYYIFVMNPFFVYPGAANANARERQRRRYNNNRIRRLGNRNDASARHVVDENGRLVLVDDLNDTATANPAQANQAQGLPLAHVVYEQQRTGSNPETDSNPETGSISDEIELGLLEAVFSFLFGDGDPGPAAREKWELVASVIVAHGGAVPGELLLPYLDDEAAACNANKHEGYAQGVLARLQGRPVATDDGLLVYQFELLAQSARREDADNIDPPAQEGGGVRARSTSVGREVHGLGVSQHQQHSSSRPNMAPTLPGFLVERDYKFSRASKEQLLIIVCLASVNLFGLLFLHYKIVYGGLEALILLRSGNRGVWAVRLVSRYHVVLLWYAVMFLVVPVVRWVLVRWMNTRKRAGNERRKRKREWFDEQLNLDSSDVNRKLKFAARVASEGTV